LGPFTPEVYVEGGYHPICASGFADNDDGARTVCQNLGWPWGGTVERTNEVLDVDAVPVGAFGNLAAGQDGMCQAGNPVGLEVTCNRTNCACNGESNDEYRNGYGGSHCESTDSDDSPPFCYVDEAMCLDEIWSGMSSKYYSYLACVLPAVGGQTGLDRANIQGYIPFTPEVYFQGKFYPVCGLGFADDNEGVAAFCRAFGFFHGGVVTKTNAVFDKDAMPVGKCNPDDDIDSCTGGGNSFGNLAGQNGQCKAGNPVGVEVICYAEATETVRAAGGRDIVGDVLFTPEVYVDGSFYPMCFADDDTSVAAAACLQAGFPHGGHMRKNVNGISSSLSSPNMSSEIYNMDALPVPMPVSPTKDVIFGSLFVSPFSYVMQVQDCKPGEIMDSCLKRSTMADDDTPEQCKAGQPIGTGIACNYQACCHFNPPMQYTGVRFN
jgi:hypothetical protein